ncbi:MAG: RHS repeat-associated core domain-containing protein [Syntrophomonas sp.]
MNRFFKVIIKPILELFLIMLIFGAISKPVMAIDTGDWLDVNGDASHSRLGSQIGPEMPGIKWSINPISIGGKMVVGPDGTIYAIGTNEGWADNTVYAITPDGNVKWSKTIGNSIISLGISAGQDGTVYFGAGQHLYFLDSNGDIIKTIDFWDEIQSPPLIGPDNTVYATVLDEGLYAFGTDGNEKWSWEPNNSYDYTDYAISNCYPALGVDGTIYLATDSGYIVALDTSGTKKWCYHGQDPTVSWNSLAVDKDGNLIAVGQNSENSNVLYLDANGNKKWSYEVAGLDLNKIALGPDGTSYIMKTSWQYSLDDSYKYIYALSPEGTLKWNYMFPGYTKDILVDQAGTIYAGIDYSSETLYALNPDGSIKWSIGNTGCYWPRALAGDGSIYTVGPSNYENQSLLCCINTGTATPAVLTAPAENSVDAAIDSPIIISFPDKMRSETITSSTFLLKDEYDNYVCGQVEALDDQTFMLTPDNNLSWKTKYTVVLKKEIRTWFGSPRASDQPLSFTTGIAPCVPLNIGVWPMQNSTAQGTRASTSTGPYIFEGSKDKWEQPYGKPLAVGVDNTLFSSQDNKLFAISPTGEVSWSGYFNNGQLEYNASDSGAEEIQKAAISYDGILYVLTSDHLYALSSYFNVLWVKDCGGECSKLVIDSLGTIYVQSNLTMYAYNRDGSIKWWRGLDTTLDGPVLDEEGNIYLCGAKDGKGIIKVFKSNGTPKLELTCEYQLSSIVAVSKNRIICKSSQVQSRTPMAGGVIIEPDNPVVVDSKGTIYDCYNHSIWAYDLNGVETCITTFAAGNATSMALDANGQIYGVLPLYRSEEDSLGNDIDKWYVFTVDTKTSTMKQLYIGAIYATYDTAWAPIVVGSNVIFLSFGWTPCTYSTPIVYPLLHAIGEGTSLDNQDPFASARQDPTCIDNLSLERDPVNTATGAHLLTRELLHCQGVLDFQFDVEYSSLLLNQGPLGVGWGHNYETNLEVLEDGNIKVHWNANRWNQFDNQGNGQFKSTDASTRHDNLVKNSDNTYTLTRKDQSSYGFTSEGQLQSVKNKYSQPLNLTYNTSGQLQNITEPVSGKTLTLEYNADGLVNIVVDNAGRQIQFVYDGNHNLTGIVDANGDTVTYTYNTKGQVVSAANSQSNQIFLNTYDSDGRVAAQDDGNSGNQATNFIYDESSMPGKIITRVTDRNGKRHMLIHDLQFNLLSKSDAIGNILSFTYDAEGNLTSSTDPNNNKTVYTYDGRGNQLTSTDPVGNTTAMTYDERNNLLSITRPDGKTTSMTYDENNNMLSLIDPAGNTTSYTYDSNGQMLTKTVTGQGTTTYTYENGLLKTQIDPTGVSITYNYDAAGRMVYTGDGSSNIITISYDSMNNPITITNSLGHTITNTYDVRGNLLTQTDPNGNTTQYTYNDNGKMITKTDALGNITTYNYDGEDRLINSTDPLGHSTSCSYDNAGRLTAITDALGNTFTIRYDAAGNITEILDAKGTSIQSQTYNSLNLLKTITNALGYTSSMNYDNLNRMTSFTDAKGRSSAYSYDDLNRLITVVDPLAGISAQSFDAAGNRLSLTDPNNNQQTFSYDGAGRMKNQQDTYGSSLSYSYNNRGLLDALTNGRGQQSSCTYDSAGRLTGINSPDETLIYTYDNNGNVLAVTGSSGTITRTYDALNRITSFRDTQNRIIGYQYDAAGNLIKLTYPDGKQVSYQYDAANRMTKVTDWALRETTYEYDVNGRLIKTCQPDGSVLTMTYDAAGQLIQQSDVDKDTQIISQYDFTYDQVSNVLTEQNKLEQTFFDSPTATMTYETDNRLATYNGQQVTYDQDGNMINGPLQGFIQTYSYDSENRLTQAGNTQYMYDPEGNRTALIQGEQETSYLVNPGAALSQVLQISQGGNEKYFVYGLKLIGSEDSSGNCEIYHYDRRGSTIAISDIYGAITDRYSYGPFGELLNHTGSSTTTFLYNGRDGVITDANGLYYMRARYYNPEIKRFINQDMLLGAIDAGQSLNRYAYVSGQPVSMVDPSGNLRGPDYVTYTVSVGAATYQVSKDLKFGHQYVTPLGVNVGISTLLSGSVTYGWLNKYFWQGEPTEKDLKDFLTGPSINVSGGFIIGGGLNFSSNGESAFELGLYSPQVGMGTGYSFK